jgi:RNA polymerase sigma-70 factor, ECF subfamily
MSSLSSQHITSRLRSWREGNEEALNELIPIVYDELHKQAKQFLRHESVDNTLQTSALINEAYIKLIDQKDVRWQNRAQFFALASQLMRRILIDHARTKHREKRGGHDLKLPLDEAVLAAADETSVDLIALDEALTGLAAFDAQQARIVELRYFGGLTINETAEALHISHATVERDWQVAKAWLHHQLKPKTI